ncbi:MAG: sodium:proton antiporter [Pseudonocardiales bacterium]|nr:MAG: sodium:proton antiporter [Pseudonocardiales bacterium]
MSRRGRLAVFSVAGLGLAVLLVAAFLDARPFGTAFHPLGDASVRASLLERATANTVASITFDQRGLDTMGEEFILFAAVLGAAVLLRRDREEREAAAPDERREGRGQVGHMPEVIRLAGYLVLPFVVVVGIYVVAHGHLTPGGGFQGGVILATGLHLVYLAGDYPALRWLQTNRIFEVSEAAGAAGYVLLGLAGLAATGAFLYNVMPYGQLGQLASAGTVPLLNAAVGIEVGSGVVLLLAEFLEQTLVLREPGGNRRAGAGG